MLAGDIEMNPGPLLHNLVFSHINARSLNVQEKFDEISSFIFDNKVSVFAVSETWLNDKISDDSLSINGYHSIIRKDRLNSRGGGVALFVEDSLIVKRRDDLACDGIELLWVEIKLRKINLLCGVCYRPPENSIEDTSLFLDHLQCSIDKVLMNSQDFVVIMGDFNAHYDIYNISSSSAFGVRFLQWLNLNNLHQLINEPTRITEHSASCLDFVITNCPNFFVDIGTFSPPLNCDHSYIFAKCSVSFARQRAFKRHIWNFSEVNISELNKELNEIELISIIENISHVDDLYSQWFSQVYNIVCKYIHNKTVIIRPRDKPWFNSKIRSAIRKRNRLLKKFNKQKTTIAWESYKAQRNNTTRLIRKAKNDFYFKLNQQLSDSATAPKKWWSCVKSMYKKKNYTSIPNLRVGAEIVTDSCEKASLFNDFFINQGRIEVSDQDLAFFTPVTRSPSLSLSNIATTDTEILNLMLKVDTSKACGHDNFSNKIIKMCCEGIAKSFSVLCNISLSRGEFISEWKKANVIPIFKKGDRQLKENYRPVSLLDSLSKIIEKVVFIRLYKFLENINFFNVHQSGFRPGDSTVYQLTLIIHCIFEALEKGKEVRMVFLDLSKAFDRVWHEGLIFKLQHIGIKDPLLSWLHSYLSERQQRVVIEGQCSNWSKISAGVPQGSVLGPLLFLIYINDICVDVQSQCFLYADDTSLFDITDDPSQSSHVLNNDLKVISQWCDKWSMKMNISKCESMTFSVKRNKIVHPTLFFEDVPIREVRSHTHLGLTLSDNLSWKEHILAIHEKASKALNVFKGLKFKLNRSTLIVLYKSLIRPLMEYGDIIWDGCSQEDSNILENIQYECARVVTGAIRGTSKANLLSELCWEDLKIRRKIHKLILFYKMVNHLTPSYLFSLLPLKQCQRSRYNLRSNDNFSLIQTRTARFKKSFLPSVILSWNELDEEARNLDSLKSFKSKIRSYYCKEYSQLLNTSLNRQASILHTRLRLNQSGLNSYLYKITCKPSPLCECNDGSVESVCHYLLHCPRYAAHRIALMSLSAQLFHNNISDKEKVQYFLNGAVFLSTENNTKLFLEVQKFIIHSKRFSK